MNKINASYLIILTGGLLLFATVHHDVLQKMIVTEASAEPYKAGKGSGYSMDELNLTGTGTESETPSDIQISLYPNPAKSGMKIYISGNYNQAHIPSEQKFTIYSLQGRTIHSGQITENGSDAEILLPSDLRPGGYILTIQSSNHMYYGKIMILDE